METIRKENGSNIETMSIHAIPTFPINSLLSVHLKEPRPSHERTNHPQFASTPRIGSNPLTHQLQTHHLNPTIPSHPHSIPTTYLPTHLTLTHPHPHPPPPPPFFPQIRARQSKQPFLSRPVWDQYSWYGMEWYGMEWNGMVGGKCGFLGLRDAG